MSPLWRPSVYVLSLGRGAVDGRLTLEGLPPLVRQIRPGAQVRLDLSGVDDFGPGVAEQVGRAVAGCYVQVSGDSPCLYDFEEVLAASMRREERAESARRNADDRR